jgi:hypothetical protein
MTMAYLLDSDVFIQAHRQHYPMDVMPGFWEALIGLADDGHILSIDEVYRELSAGDDELAEWATENRDALFRANDDDDTQSAFGDVATAMEERTPAFRAEAKDVFLDAADPWLIAYARAHGHMLVSQEQATTGAVRVVKIPDITPLVDVDCIRTVEMLRALGVRLVRG